MNQPTLEVGFMPNEALAAWFGVAKDTLRKKKKTMLPRLKSFADFEVSHGGVIIKEVYCSTYGADAYPRVKELLPEYWSLSGLDTSKRVANKIYDRLNLEGYQNSPSTVYKYVRKARKELFGDARTGEPGTMGSSSHELARYSTLTYEALPLTEAQWKIVEDVTKATFNVSPPQIIANGLKALQDDAETTISKKEMENILTHGNSYTGWKRNLEAALGFTIVNATRIHRNIEPED